MRLIFIQPAVGRKGGGAVYPKTWIMEPLWAATIAALLPKDCERLLMDELPSLLRTWWRLPIFLLRCMVRFRRPAACSFLLLI